MIDPAVDATIRQSLDVPMQGAAEVKDHIAALQELISWSAVAVLYDDLPSAVLVVQLDADTVVGVCRLALSPSEAVEAVEAYSVPNEVLRLACCQGAEFSRDQIIDLSVLTELFQSASSKAVTGEQLREFFERVEEGSRRRGRGPDINTETRNQVLFDAHGRCMFEGCGTDLTWDPVSGRRGNFAYLAHNVASSESGPRGVLYLSKELSNEPDNILLLCDVHHRIVDTIAKADYPAHRLQNMRRQYCDDSIALLDRLQLAKIPAFCVTWPVHQQTIAAPTPTQIAEALVPIGARLDGYLRRVGDNDRVLREMDVEALWSLMPVAIDAAASDILLQAQSESHRAALFAMGLMPSLIALGAKLGNKNTITPMLLHREAGLWYWPASEPRVDWYDVRGLKSLPARCQDVVLEVAFTAQPQSMINTREALGFPSITIIAAGEFLGNGALGHPHDGRRFRQDMQELWHRLRDSHGVERVHLLPCMSNAASVFLGQAFDSYHPSIIVYDFLQNESRMVKRLSISNVDNRCEVTTAPLSHP